jgi:hypothetical protein
MRKVVVASIIVILVALIAGCAGGGEADTTPPVISEVSVSNITGTSVVITWTTDEPATSQVTYGGIYCLGGISCLPPPDENLVTSHSFSLGGLSPNSNYRLSVISKDKAGNERQSQNYVFATHLEIDEVISCDTTWTKEGSPYIITANLLIPNGITLTIEPGVTVKFESGKAMQIDGELVARGTEAEPIVFTSNQPSPSPGDWRSILFTDSSVDATCDEMGNYLSGCIMQYCAVEYGGSDTPLIKYTPAIKLISSSPLIDHCTIINNAGSGVYVLRGSATIANSLISNNSAFCWGGGICCFYHDGAVNIKGNTISHNSVDFSGAGIYADCYDGTLTISDNEISGNSADNGGGGVLLNCYGGAVTISSNIITNNSGGGICCSGHSRYGTVTVSGNLISDNSDYNGGGIYCWVEDGAISIDHNEIHGNSQNGIYIFRGNPVINYNNLVGNTPCEIYDNDWTDSPPVDATHNWWGTTNEAEIVEKVCSRSYGAGQRMVNYSSYLMEGVPIEAE